MRIILVYKHAGMACFTGGEYSREEVYEHHGGDKWVRGWWSSAWQEWDFCRGCGRFHEPPECDKTQITTDKVLENLIAYLRTHNQVYIEAGDNYIVLHPHRPEPEGRCCW